MFLGAVELENLPLKKDALKELELPFEVKAGAWGQRREVGLETKVSGQENKSPGVGRQEV